jgi:small GTP-binding protein
LSLSKLKYSFKVVVIGDPGVGKTSTVRVFATGKFEKNYIPTLGVNILSKTFTFRNIEVTLVIWDLAGQGFMDEVRAQYYNGAKAVVIVYDITKADSFARVVGWNEECVKFARDIVTRIVVGNKTDLSPQREVQTQDGMRLAKEIGAGFYETSAKTGQNIAVAFASCAVSLLKSQLASLEKKMSVLIEKERAKEPSVPLNNQSAVERL